MIAAVRLADTCEGPGLLVVISAACLVIGIVWLLLEEGRRARRRR